MKIKTFVAVVLMAVMVAPVATLAQQNEVEVPIKNITRVEGVRSNQLKGFGIVTGLAGTGDGQIPFVNRSIANALSRLGIKVQDPQEAQLNNIAAVVVTAELPAFKSSGDEINVTLSSIGSAEDLSGGVLMQTPLKANNGKVYAAAQGPITKGGDAEDRHLTTVRIPNGGIVERSVPFEFVGDQNTIELRLMNPDFSTADCIARQINEEFSRELAHAANAGAVRVEIPRRFIENPVEFISMVEEIEVHPKEEARVVINERTGTVLMGGDLALRPVSISHGNLSVQVAGDEEETNGESVVLPRSTSVQQLVDSLNSVGASTPAVIAILESMDQAGALTAPLEVM
jgi:flagellar P-ring protein precursor FlgI